MTAPIGTPAKRGDLACIQCRSSCTMLHGPTVSNPYYSLAVVTSVSREGRIKATRILGETFVSKSTPAHCSVVDAAVLDMRALEAAYIARGEHSTARNFETLEAVREFVRSFRDLRTSGQRAYEEDLQRQPLYENGTQRATWDLLDAIARDSWERNPTVRAKSLRKQISDLRAEMRANGIREVSCMNGGHTTESMRYNTRLFYLRSQVKQAI